MTQAALFLEHDLAGIIDDEIPLEVPEDSAEPSAGIAQRMAAIRADLLGKAGGEKKFSEETGSIIRGALDYVIDAPTLARYSIDDLEPDEKTSVGKRIERMLRFKFDIQRGKKLDIILAEEDVDIKTTMSNKWMFSKSSWEHVNLLIAYNEKKAEFSAGLVYVVEAELGAKNRDSKRTLRSKYYENISWIVKNVSYPPNFLAELAPSTLQQIVSHRWGTQRVDALFEHVQEKRIPRHSICSVANQIDALKRIRKNGGARTSLWKKRILVLSGTFLGDRKIAQEALGIALCKDEVASISAQSPALSSQMLKMYMKNHGLHDDGVLTL